MPEWLKDKTRVNISSIPKVVYENNDLRLSCYSKRFVSIFWYRGELLIDRQLRKVLISCLFLEFMWNMNSSWNLNGGIGNVSKLNGTRLRFTHNAACECFIKTICHVLNSFFGFSAYNWENISKSQIPNRMWGPLDEFARALFLILGKELNPWLSP